MIRPSPILAALAALALCLHAPSARAQDVAEQVDILLGDAYAYYDDLLLDDAEITLLGALDLVEAYDLRTPSAAGTYIMLGVVWAARDGDPWVAYDTFVDGLSIDPLAEIHPYYATPSLVEVFEEARLNARPAEPARPDSPATPTAPTAGDETLSHTPAREVQENRPLRLVATVGLQTPVARVDAYYRPFGERIYLTTPLAPVGDGVTWTGDLPASASRGVISLDYYLEATDRAGNVLGTAGTAASPISALVVGSDAPDSRARDRSRAPRDRGDGEIAHLSLGVGSGIGLATAQPNVYAQDVDLNPGLALTPVHLGLEVGFAPGRRSLHIVPFLRAQLVFLDTGVELEPLGGVKLRYFFDDDGPFRAYAQGGLGYGYVSHLVRLEAVEDGVYDTTNEGPFHIGGGAGFAYMISDTFGLQFDAYLMAMFGEFSIQLDGTLGAYVAF